MRTIEWPRSTSRLYHAHVLSSICLLMMLATTQPLSAQQTPALSPSSAYTPEEVVKIVIDALGNNKQLGDDEGIAIVYRFASPGNRANTGPLPRFTAMIKRGFSDMLDHEGSRYSPMEITGDTAVQAVWLKTPDDMEVGYAFQLGKQTDGQYQGMWMTDAVLPLGSRRLGTRI